MNLACGKTVIFFSNPPNPSAAPSPRSCTQRECLTFRSKIPLSEDSEFAYVSAYHLRADVGWGGLIGFRVVQVDFAQVVSPSGTQFFQSHHTTPPSYTSSHRQGQQSGSLSKAAFAFPFCESSLLCSQPRTFDNKCSANL